LLHVAAQGPIAFVKVMDLTGRTEGAIGGIRSRALVHKIRNVNNDGISDLFSRLHEQSAGFVV